jgi:hypothetical protein
MASSVRRAAGLAANDVETLTLVDGGDEVGGDDDDDDADENGDGGADDDGGLIEGRSANTETTCDAAAAASEVCPADEAAGTPREMEHLFSCLCWVRPALLKKRLE